MPNPELQPTISPVSELKHAFTEAQTDYLEKLNKQLLELTEGKGLEQLKLDDYPVETQEKILELGETIEKVARGEVEGESQIETEEGVWTKERVIQWVKEQVSKNKEWVDKCVERFDFSELPKIKVGGSLYLYRTNLKFLPDNLEVGIDLYLSFCKNLKSLPDDLKVGGDLDIRGCKESVKIKAQKLKDKGNIKGEIKT